MKLSAEKHDLPFLLWYYNGYYPGYYHAWAPLVKMYVWHLGFSDQPGRSQQTTKINSSSLENCNLRCSAIAIYNNSFPHCISAAYNDRPLGGQLIVFLCVMSEAGEDLSIKNTVRPHTDKQLYVISVTCLQLIVRHRQINVCFVRSSELYFTMLLLIRGVN